MNYEILIDASIDILVINCVTMREAFELISIAKKIVWNFIYDYFIIQQLLSIGQ